MGEIKLDQEKMLHNISALQYSLNDFILTDNLTCGVGEGSPAMERFVELYHAFEKLIEQYKMKLEDDLRFVDKSLNLLAEQESNFAQFFKDNPIGSSPFEELSGVSL